ncbi:hypothetical protein GCM10009641_26380 [Mycobacterium cookii]|uniref:Outer membrane protein n=1 Tax=Mycobacterium cookii TaxID=1775 RepID=A0A7I7KT40_9MYCO|nr:hypothetical protein [Mycobacterium cookii]MCV7331272.1 hypothetical protein [Mycobacterium cookii]BBX44771.1 hypothetical protein MCOO_07860 [Mycobacterium cookii]
MRWPKPRRTSDRPVDDTAPEIADAEVGEPDRDEQPTAPGRRRRESRALAYTLLPVLALLLASAAGYLKWQQESVREAQVAGAESLRAATDGAIALLSYKPETVQKDLDAARSRLTGTFLNAYTSLTHDVVIPGAQQKQIAAVASVPAAATVQASASHAVVLLFINQSLTIGQDVPTNSASSVQVGLDKIDGRWLISKFDPV